MYLGFQLHFTLKSKNDILVYMFKFLLLTVDIFIQAVIIRVRASSEFSHTRRETVVQHSPWLHKTTSLILKIYTGLNGQTLEKELWTVWRAAQHAWEHQLGNQPAFLASLCSSVSLRRLLVSWVPKSLFANGINNDNSCVTPMMFGSMSIFNTWNRCLARSKVYDSHDSNVNDVCDKPIPSRKQNIQT